jgi:hypothetical protein
MKKFLIKTFVFLITLSCSYVYAKYNFEQCKEYSGSLNKSYPMSINKDTVINGTYCVPSNDGYALLYDIIFNTKNINYSSKMIGNVVKNLCTNPETIQLLKVVDMRYQYKSQDGNYLGGFVVTINDCSK